MVNSKAFKKKVRAFMAANPGMSYQAAMNHLRALRPATDAPEKTGVRINGRKARPEEVAPDYSRGCLNCGAKPVMPATGLCGPCTTGEADTSGGNW